MITEGAGGYSIAADQPDIREEALVHFVL